MTKHKPKPYQEEGIEQMIAWKSCIQADDCGLGKTMQAILAVERQNTYPLLIICPASLKTNWEIEFKMWTGRTAMSITDSMKNTFPMFYQAGICDAFIVNYESLKKYFVYSMPKRKDIMLADIIMNKYKNIFKSVIVDESHRVKEPTAIQTKLTAGICEGKKVKYLLSGTPVMNSVLDLTTQLAITDKIHLFGGYEKFQRDYKNATHEQLEHLQLMLKKNCLIRREKNVVGLPPKTRQIIYVDIDNRAEYNSALKDLSSYLRDFKGKSNHEINRSMKAEVMVRIGLLKQISARGKISAVKENIESLFEQNEKVVLFGHSIDALNQFRSIKGSVAITGSESKEQKHHSVTSFQEDKETMLAICSLMSAGVGLTLTAGRFNYFIETWWNPAIQNQAEDRQHRIGQEREVHSVYFIGVNTIDKYIYDVIEQKRTMSNAITGSADDIEWGVVEEVIELLLQND